ncbi:hemagglutinin [Veillonella sp. oral taxon 780]|uniref:hemagglutinin n=1 Tax=Veillonella sp. oral taxon 780 TaxID=671229 RepID=UPI00021A2162|nr:hemagglutinin [Veillonella sp. oral taxon 780]EGS33493.1 hemagglutinin [Veillonella sp. oral taxon 780 str. F0422]
METAALDFAKNKNGHASTSLGVHALSKGDLSTAIGAGSRSEAIGSVALGVGAHATRQNAVAIGTGSTTDLVGTRQLSVSYDKDGNVVDDNSPNKAYTFNWAGGTNTAEGDVVSFGSSGSERQLKNVAAGRVAEDSTDAINGSQLNAISKKLATGWNIAGDPKTKVAGIGTDDQVNFVNGNGTTVTVTKQEEVKNGNTITTAKGANVKFDVKAADGSITSDANGISVNTDGDTIGKTADGKLKANTGTINTGNDGKAAPNTGDGNKLATVDTVVNAVNNAAWKATAGSVDSGTETGKSEEKIKAGDVVTFKAGDNLAIKQDGKNFIYSLKPELTGLTSAGFKNAAGDTTVIDGNGMTITSKDAPANPVSLTKEGLDNGGKTIKNVTSGLINYSAGTPKEGLVDLSKPATGTPVPDTTAATVGDLRNMGWVVSSDKTTGELTKAYTDQVKNADEVKFVGEGGVTVSGKTENGIRTITVKAEAQEMPEQPVSYTTADGTKVYPKTVTKEDGTKEVKYYSEPNGKGTEIPKENVIASINGPEGTKAPTTLSNVAGNLDGAKKDTKAPTTEHAPVNTTDAAGPNYVNPNNAATVGDVLNAGWNLQNNSTAKDFVKPYDTVNFVNGANTTAVVTTNEDGTTSNVTYNVTGLPVTYTDAEGNPVAKVGDKYYKVNDKGQPVDADGNPSTKVNDKGQPLDAQGNVIDPVDTTKPLKTALVNPTPEADKTSTTSPTSLNNVKNNIPTVNDADKKAYDVNGAPIDGKKNTAAPITAKEAADLLNPTKDGQPNPNFVGNNAATVSDVLNAGWNLQNNGEARDFVKPYDTVNFVNGANTTAVVTTSADGTTSDVTYNVTGLPVTFTDKDGKPVSKIGDKYYPVNEKGQPITPDGKPAVKTNAEGKPVAEDGTVIEPVDTTKPLKTALVNPTPAGDKTNTTDPTALNNVTSGLNKYGDTVDGAQVPGSTPANNGLVDLSKPADGSEPKVSDNTAATVGDLRNMGWIVSSDKTTGNLGNPYSEAVKNANEVKFVGEGTATVSGKTDEKGVRTITVKVDDQASANNAVSPVVYTDENGDRVYPTGEKDPQGNPIFKKNPDGTGDTVTGPVKTSINGPKGTKTPATLDNVKHNLPTVNDTDKKASDVDGNPIDGKNNTAAPITAADAADLLNPTKDGQPNPKFAGNNAATVSDVLNAGWNLQNNGEARDFVKPYDTVNFVNGANTTAVVTTAADGTTSDVTYNVTGLPVTFTDKDGKPVSKIGDKYYPVNEKGQPVSEKGNPAVGTNNDGDLVDKDGNVIKPIDTAKDPLKSNMVNPNVANTTEKPNNQTTSPTQLGNVANGANTFDPVEDKKLGNDGKWYNAADVLPNGQPKENVQPVAKPDTVGKAGLIDFSNSNPNNAATVGDLQNLGWIVSAEGNSYSDQVRNANEVKFVGEGTATVTGKTDDKGVRTITVKVDDQVSTNNAQTPVVYTDKDGKKVYPIKGDDGTVTYHTTPDGKGDNDEVVPNNNVVTSINGPEGTTSPTELKNVKNNIPAVNDADKKVTNPDGTEKGTAGDVNNINKAPLTATEAADLLNPTKDGKPNPNFVGNNAATVSDVLNVGWNLQNNGTAKDFVKPYDTVNFVDGANTTAVVTTNEDGTTSNVTYNVTGLPVTFTDKDGKPVSKIGDKYYPVNEKGQPITPDGKPAVKTNAEGKPVTEDGTVIEPIDTAKDPLKSNMVNPNVANTADAPNNQTTTPTQLGNVKSNLPTVNDADKKASDVDGNPIAVKTIQQRLLQQQMQLTY